MEAETGQEKAGEALARFPRFFFQGLVIRGGPHLVVQEDLIRGFAPIRFGDVPSSMMLAEALSLMVPSCADDPDIARVELDLNAARTSARP